MSNASKFRKKAVEYEQLKQFDRAVASYVRAIEENESAGEEVDVALFNKVGDLTLRQGRVTEAVTYYERAVEHYVSGALFDNAIALCNKILRNAPGRSNVYFTLGRICGRKGLRSDATRNFLEYATRMQGEGRVDEGMRALAEVADLMPELTEVGRLVEEHAVRAGITLKRRTATPAQAVTALPTNAAGNSFGMSKDLVFLDIEYDAPKTVRGKTPPPIRTIRATPPIATNSVSPAEPVESVPHALPEFLDIGANSVVAEISAANPVTNGNAAIPAQRATVDANDTVERAPIASTPLYNDTIEVARPVDEFDVTDDAIDDTPKLTVRLEDLLIFDPADAEHDQQSTAEHAHEAPAANVVVDGASILRPFVDPSTPLPSLDGLEPTEQITTPKFTEAVKAQPAMPELLERGVSRAREEVVAPETENEFAESATTSFEDALIDVSFDAPAVDEIVNDDSTAFAPVEFDVIAPVVGEQLDEYVAELHDEYVDAHVDPCADAYADATVVHEVGDVEDGSEFDVVDDAVSADVPIAEIDSIDHADEAPVGATNAFNDNSFEIEIIAGALDGFTSEEHLHAPEVHVTGSVDVIAEPDVESEPERVGALDLEAMLVDAENQVARIDDLQSEEFAPANDELAAKRFVRQDDEAPSRADAFDAADELPPLIFPMPFDAYPFKSIDTFAALGTSDDRAPLFAEETNEPAEFGDAFESPLFEAPAVDAPLFDTTAFEPPTFETEFEQPAFDATSLEALSLNETEFAEPTVDAAYDDGYEVPVELPFIVAGDAFEADDAIDVTAHATADEEFAIGRQDVFVAEDTSDLDDLFTDAVVPTAVAAAEAAVVASSRRDDLRQAVAAAPTDWTLRRRLAEALFEAGERDAAIAELSAAQIGHEQAGALNEAAEISDELVRVAGDNVGHHQKRVELAIRLGDQNRLREAYLDLADNLVRKNDDLRARAVYARVLEIDPWDDRARTALGDAAPPPPERIIAGSDSDSIDLAAWLRDDDEPHSTRLRMREPEVSGNEQEDFNSLLKHFKEGVARSLGEDDHDSHYDLGVAYKEMGLLDDAIGEFQKALRSRNNRLAAYEALGQCFLEQQSYKVAVTVLSRALHEPAIRDEQRVGVLYLLGYSCEALQRFDEARSYFQRVYATDIHFRDVAQRLADLERITR